MGYHRRGVIQVEAHTSDMMQNVAPTRRLQRRSRDLLIAAALVFLLGAALLVGGISLHILSLVVPYNPGYAVYDLTRKAMLAIGIGIAVAAMLMALRSITWKTDNATAYQVGELLAQRLDQRFVFIRNIRGRSLGAIDAALISQHGVLVMRVTGRRGEYMHDGGRWLRRRRGGNWRLLRWNPTREAAASAFKLKQYLSDYQLSSVPVYAAVVFARGSQEAKLRLQQPAVPVVHASSLIDSLGDSYFAEYRLDAATVQEVVNLLYH